MLGMKRQKEKSNDYFCYFPSLIKTQPTQETGQFQKYFTQNNKETTNRGNVSIVTSPVTTCQDTPTSTAEQSYTSSALWGLL